MKIDQNTVLGLEPWAMLLLNAGWDRAADEVFAVIEQRQRETADESAAGAQEFSG
jgi:hypothetical protein